MSTREIIVGVCGGIAAYKVAGVVSTLTQQGLGVNVVMTEFAQQFVTPLTFQTLSARRVITGYTTEPKDYSPTHISLASGCELMLIAPATANVIGKIAAGIADDILTTTFLSVACPVIVAPAMNDNMYKNPAVQQNISLIKKRGIEIIKPEEGRLACGSEGVGRLADPTRIIEVVNRALARRA